MAKKNKVEFVASANRRVFHREDCDWAKQYLIGSQNAIWFSTAKEAHKMGYDGCRDCHPDQER